MWTLIIVYLIAFLVVHLWVYEIIPHPCAILDSITDPWGLLQMSTALFLQSYTLSSTLNLAASLDCVNSDICFLISKIFLSFVGFLLSIWDLQISSTLNTGAVVYFLSLRYRPMLPAVQCLTEVFLLTFLTPKMWATFFLSTPTNSPTLWTLTRCHAIPFNSDTNGWEFSRSLKWLRCQLQIRGGHL